jgi:Ca2+:H+ antiporter
MNKLFLWLLVFVPAAALADLFHVGAVPTFFLSAIAIIPLAKFIGDGTESLAAHTTAAWGGFLNVTFGNATELIVGIFALRAGLLEVVKASITGSIIGNLLLVLGTAVFVGGCRHKKQVFNRTAALASGSTLFLAVTALIIPTIFPASAPSASPAVIEQLSLVVAACMIVMYSASLVFSLGTHKHLYVVEADEEEHRWSVKQGIAVLALATLAVAWMSNILVGAIGPLTQSLGWTQLFVGVIIIAIVGNAAEHASAITMAVKNKTDLTLQIAMGSATQMAIFVAPALVLLSMFFTEPMNLVFNMFELVSMVVSVVIVNLIVQDGETNWLEGVQLLVAYGIMAVAFFLHP